MGRILVVEDDLAISELLRQVLGRAGHEVEIAENGAVAERILVESGADLAVADIISSGSAGFDLIMDLRRDNPALKIIAVAGGSDVNGVPQKDVALGVGADVVVGRPFVMDEFLDAIGTLTGAREESGVVGGEDR